MKNYLLTIFLFLTNFVMAQFSSGTVALGATGMTVKLDTTPTLVTLTLTGNSGSYLGVGGGNQGMATGADGFIYNSGSTTNTNLDYTFGGVGVTPTPDAVQDWTIVSNTISGSTRTIVATRSLSGGAGDVPIPNAAGPIDIFYAKGSALSLAYHGSSNRGYAILNMTAGSLNTNDLVLNKNTNIIYPNPVGDVLYFTNPEKLVSVKIYDASGKNVKNLKLEDNGIVVSDLHSGTYYIEMINKNGSSTYERILKK